MENPQFALGLGQFAKKKHIMKNIKGRSGIAGRQRIDLDSNTDSDY